MGGYPCCCAGCPNCTGKMGSPVVQIDGIGGDSCNCANFNRTFVFNYDPPMIDREAGTCTWDWDLAGLLPALPFCGADVLRLVLDHDGSQYRLTLLAIDTDTSTTIWSAQKQIGTTKPACRTETGPYPFELDETDCDFTGGYCQDNGSGITIGIRLGAL